MAVHQQYESSQAGYRSALLGYSPQLRGTLLELRQQSAPTTAAAAAVPGAQQAGAAENPLAAAAQGGPRLQRFTVEVAGTLEQEVARLQVPDLPTSSLQQC